jgi:acetyl-CoA C-acetyltransferase
MAQIVGWGHTPFGRHPDKSLEDLIRDAGGEALRHAGIAAGDVGAVWIGHFNAGMVGDAFPSSLALSIDDALRFVPAARAENACASGSAAIYSALDAIRSGRIDIALVVGVEKMSHLPTAEVAEALGGASYQPEEAGVSFPQVFSQFARAYFDAFGDKSRALAEIAVKNHRNAMANPLAQMQRPLTLEFCSTVSNKNPMIADPLKVTDCSLVSDGAAAIVIASDEAAKAFARAVRFRSTAHVSDFLPMSRRDLTAFEGPRRAISLAREQAGLQNGDLHVAEVHDCFTIAELMIYEAMDLAPAGEGERALREGIVLPGGRLPVNLSGGLKAKGHPVGATGVSMHVMIARQLTGTADAMQVPGASLGIVFNMGGSGVANYCSILETARA